MTARRLRAAALFAFTAWVVACALLLLGAARDGRRGLSAVNAAEARTAPADLLSGAPVQPLAAARRSFASAHRRLDHPFIAPLRLLPVAGRQLRTATAMVGAARTVSAVGADSVDRARVALEQPHATGPDRIVLLRKLRTIAADAERDLRPIKLGPSKALIGPIADRRAELADKLGSVRRGLRDAVAATGGLTDVLTGPRRYLLLAANNAEMRGGSGMFLSAGEITFNNGDMALSELRPTGDLNLAPEKAPPIEDADVAARWGFLNPNREWRNLATSPRFPASAQLAARMWPLTGGAPVDGVLALDPVALQALLKATGPVDVAGQSVNADGVIDLLLHDQYLEVQSAGGFYDPAQAARREQLGQIARTVIDKLTAGPFDVGTLAGSLANAAHGRHVLAWSARPGDQQAWEAAGVDGAVTADSLMATLLNRGGNKLDYFMDVDADLALAPAGQEQKAVLTIKVKNKTPEKENVYIAGPFPGVDVEAGEYLGYVSVELPKGAATPAIDGFSTFAAAGPDGPAQVVAVPFRLKRGAETTLVLRFRLSNAGQLTVEPSARVPAITWHAQGLTWKDGERRQVRWG